MARFELKNYKNVLIIDESILISNTFYQSADDFFYRAKNSKSDELELISNITEINYHDIGNRIILKFNRKKRTLVFMSNQSMKEFVSYLDLDDLELSERKNLSKAASIVPAIIPLLIVLIVLFIIFRKNSANAFMTYGMLFLGMITAIYLIIKKMSQSHMVTYKKRPRTN